MEICMCSLSALLFGSGKMSLDNSVKSFRLAKGGIEDEEEIIKRQIIALDRELT